MKPLPQHFSKVLIDELGTRIKRNPSYSLRAFARDLNLSASNLSSLLSRKSGLSKAKSVEIAKRLNLGTGDREFFLNLVQANCAKIKLDRQVAMARLLRFETTYNTLTSEVFKVIADWYHLAIVELCLLKGFEPMGSWIGEKLSIPEALASDALDRLIKLEVLITKDGKLFPATDYLIILSNAPSESAQLFQTQILQKLNHSLIHHDRSTRDIASVVLRLRSSELDKIKDELKYLRRDFSAKLQSGDDHDSVYCFTTSLFRLDG